MTPTVQVLAGDCRERLAALPESSIHCCVTSPPYWGLRDYGVNGQLGLEATPEEYVRKMVAVFREVRRVLRDDGTVWLNLGDSYAGAGAGGGGNRKGNEHGQHDAMVGSIRGTVPSGLKPKDLCGIPWRLAFALQADGWWLRQDIIWAKPNPMPESVTDRCTKAHEYLFLLSKSERYYFDQQAILEPVTGHAHRRSAVKPPAGWGVDDEPRTAIELQRAGIHRKTRPGVTPKSALPGNGIKSNASFNGTVVDLVSERNKRSVWTVPSMPYADAHFATYPPDLIKPCILAGCPSGGTVLDPFAGSGTTGQVALELGRSAVLIELNPDYVKLIEQRIHVTPGLAL